MTAILSSGRSKKARLNWIQLTVMKQSNASMQLSIDYCMPCESACVSNKSNDVIWFDINWLWWRCWQFDKHSNRSRAINFIQSFSRFDWILSRFCCFLFRIFRLDRAIISPTTNGVWSKTEIKETEKMKWSEKCLCSCRTSHRRLHWLISTIVWMENKAILHVTENCA